MSLTPVDASIDRLHRRPIDSEPLSIEVPCPQCGFAANHLWPDDVAVAARSFGQRWRELLSGVAAREDNGDALLHQRLVSGWSVIERADHVAKVCERTTTDFTRIWTQDRPVLDEVSVTAATAPSTGLDDAIAAVASATEHLPTRIEARATPGAASAGQESRSARFGSCARRSTKAPTIFASLTTRSRWMQARTRRAINAHLLPARSPTT